MRFIRLAVLIFAFTGFALSSAQEPLNDLPDYSNKTTKDLQGLHAAGDVHATFSLGFNRFFNDDTSMKENVSDVEAGLSYLQEAHDKGHTDAHSALSAIYRFGLFDVPKNAEKANAYDLQGAERGSDVGKLNYGIHNLDNANANIAQQAHDYLFEIAGKDQVGGSANQYLSSLYYFGNQHFDADYESARLFAENCVLFKASEGNCEFILARDYSQGWGGPEDQARSAALFLQGAEGGNSAAMWYAGMNALNGNHVEKSETEAFNWVQKSAYLDYENAMISLGVMYALGQGTEVDYEKSYQSYGRAAALGSAHAVRGMAAMYCQGEGKDKDVDICGAGLVLAALHGDDQAPLLLSDFFQINAEDIILSDFPQANFWTDKYAWLLK